MELTLKDISYILAFLIEIAVPIVLAAVISKKYRVSWSIFFLGLGLFLASLVRIPLNNYVNSILLNSSIKFIYPMTLIIIFASVTAGLFEEGVRVLGIGFIVKNKNYHKGLMYGVGHGGGGESMLFVGLSTLANYIIYKFFPGILPSAAIRQFDSLGWYLPLVGALERIFAIGIQVFLSVLIMHAFLNKRYWIISIAILIHIIVDFVAAYIQQTVGNMWLTEGIVFIFFAVSVFFIFYLKPKEKLEKEVNSSITI